MAPALGPWSGAACPGSAHQVAGRLFMRKGAGFLDIGVTVLMKEISLLTQEQRIALETQLGAAAAARME